MVPCKSLVMISKHVFPGPMALTSRNTNVTYTQKSFLNVNQKVGNHFEWLDILHQYFMMQTQTCYKFCFKISMWQMCAKSVYQTLFHEFSFTYETPKGLICGHIILSYPISHMKFSGLSYIRNRNNICTQSHSYLFLSQTLWYKAYLYITVTS